MSLKLFLGISTSFHQLFKTQLRSKQEKYSQHDLSTSGKTLFTLHKTPYFVTIQIQEAKLVMQLIEKKYYVTGLLKMLSTWNFFTVSDINSLNFCTRESRATE